MRLGAHLFGNTTDPDLWIKALKDKGYTAAYSTPFDEADTENIQAYLKAAKDNNIVIAEVGAWSNPMSPDEAVRDEAIKLNMDRLALADTIGARCCVNISGSRSKIWAAPDPKNLTQETFDMIVEVVRGIIDTVKPIRTYYALETMPWMYPNSVDSYVKLIEAIDRPRFAVHFDPVNLICSPQLYYTNADVIKDFVAKLGPYIRCCHAKDILLSDKLTTHLDEVRPGLGYLDYGVYLKQISKLDPDTPVMLEHLDTEQEYDLAADYIRSVASLNKLNLE